MSSVALLLSAALASLIAFESGTTAEAEARDERERVGDAATTT